MIDVIYLQGFDRCTSRCGFADYLCAVFAELKMFVPYLLAWIEKFDGFSCEIINRFGFCCFVGITFTAGEP